MYVDVQLSQLLAGRPVSVQGPGPRPVVALCFCLLHFSPQIGPALSYPLCCIQAHQSAVDSQEAAQPFAWHLPSLSNEPAVPQAMSACQTAPAAPKRTTATTQSPKRAPVARIPSPVSMVSAVTRHRVMCVHCSLALQVNSAALRAIVWWLGMPIHIQGPLFFPL